MNLPRRERWFEVRFGRIVFNWVHAQITFLLFPLNSDPNGDRNIIWNR